MHSEISAQIPSAYQHLLPSAMLEGAPRERNATCTNCAMCTTGPSPLTPRAATMEGGFFDPQTKCCTYHPDLPNYAVGGILQDQAADAAEGRLRVQTKIAGRVGVLPTGIARPKKHRLMYNNGHDAFGHATSLRCPFYIEEGGMCSVWKYREAVCSTWFCKYEHGAQGQLYWNAVCDYLEHLQEVLVRYSLTQLGWPVTELFGVEWGDPFAIGNNRLSNRPLGPEDLDERAPRESLYRRIWGAWVGREAELYAQCYEISKKVTRGDVRRLGGYHLELLEERISLQHEAMTSKVVPEMLRRNPDLRVQRQSDGRFVVTSYRRYDPIVLSADVYSLLDWFDGTNLTEQVIAKLDKEKGLQLSGALVRRLYERRILIPDALDADIRSTAR